MKNQDKLFGIIKELHRVSGFRISLFSTDFREIIAYPETKLEFCSCVQKDPRALEFCNRCDKEAFVRVRETGKTYLYTCHFGLIEAVSPIYHYGVLSGYLMMGQVRASDGASAELIEANAHEFTPSEELAPLIGRIPIHDRDMIESYVNIMTVLAQYITLSNIMQVFGQDLAELIKLYLNSHFSENISLDRLCETFNCSKTTLLTSYKKAYGVTVYKYLSELRLSKSCELLSDSHYPIGEIASLCGFPDQCYFSKVFSKRYGMAPSAYREQKINEQ
ncbi:MAG: helix-turn-helix domain-containing protein [Ruminococcaceae bacterium]|nr:helix-turn-helix domain-containing protein [Oscillospiraceae bacterium]